MAVCARRGGSGLSRRALVAGRGGAGGPRRGVRRAAHDGRSVPARSRDPLRRSAGGARRSAGGRRRPRFGVREAPRGHEDDARGRRARRRLHGAPGSLCAAGRLAGDRFPHAPRASRLVRGTLAPGGRAAAPGGRSGPSGDGRPGCAARPRAHAGVTRRVQRGPRRRAAPLDRGVRARSGLGAFGSERAREYRDGEAPCARKASRPPVFTWTSSAAPPS